MGRTSGSLRVDHPSEDPVRKLDTLRWGRIAYQGVAPGWVRSREWVPFFHHN
jgi:hypothetical protein